MPLKKAWPALLLAACTAYVVWFWRPLLLQGLVVIDGDAFPYYYPTWAIGKRLLQEGGSLLWDPYRNMGQPFLADPRNQALYPLRLLSLFMGYVDYQRIYVVFHSLLAAAFAALIVRRHCREPEPMLLAALGAAFNGYAYWRILYSSDLAALAWLPAAFFFLMERRPIALALCLSLQWLSGFTPYCLLTFAALAAYASTEGFRALVCLLKGLALMLGLCAVQILPFIELIGELDRPMFLDPGLAFEHSLSWPDLLRQSITPAFLKPWVNQGAPAMSSFYFGPVLGGLFVLGMLRGEGRERRLGALGLLFLLLAAGKNLPGYRLLPFITVFRFPSQWLAPFTLLFALTAAAGLSRLRSRTLRAALVLLAAADLLFYADPRFFNWGDQRYLTAVPDLFKSPNLFDPHYRTFHSKRFIEASRNWWRGSAEDWQLFKAALTPSFGASLGLREAASYYTLPTRRTRAYRLRMAAQPLGSPLYDHAGVRSIITLSEEHVLGSGLIRPEQLRLATNPGAKEHVFGLDGQRVELLEDKPGDLLARVHGPGLVVLSEAHYPGWTARRDGRPVPLELFEGAFPAVRLSEPGSVRFRYRPASALLGALVSLATLIALGIGMKRRQGKT
ncbi:MAG: hypothetical protein AAB412_02510 [Elusimicrobiota bacterium]